MLCTRLTVEGGTPAALLVGGVREGPPGCGILVGLPGVSAESTVLVLTAVCTGDRVVLPESNLSAQLKAE